MRQKRSRMMREALLALTFCLSVAINLVPGEAMAQAAMYHGRTVSLFSNAIYNNRWVLAGKPGEIMHAKRPELVVTENWGWLKFNPGGGEAEGRAYISVKDTTERGVNCPEGWPRFKGLETRSILGFYDGSYDSKTGVFQGKFNHVEETLNGPCPKELFRRWDETALDWVGQFVEPGVIEIYYANPQIGTGLVMRVKGTPVAPPKESSDSGASLPPGASTGSGGSAPPDQESRRITIVSVIGEAEVIREGADAIVLEGGETIGLDDRIYTGMESKVVLGFSDGTRVVVEELTDVKVANHQTQGSSVQTRLWLKAGELDAEVTPRAGLNSDFSIRTPTATKSVRGTRFTARYVERPYPLSVVEVQEGAVLVTPQNPTLPQVLVRPGGEVRVSNDEVKRRGDVIDSPQDPWGPQADGGAAADAVTASAGANGATTTPGASVATAEGGATTDAGGALTGAGGAVTTAGGGGSNGGGAVGLGGPTGTAGGQRLVLREIIHAPFRTTGSPSLVRCDATGGVLEVDVAYGGDCTERYRFEFAFDRNMSVLQPDAEYGFTYSAEILGAKCKLNPWRDPHIVAGATNGFSSTLYKTSGYDRWVYALGGGGPRVMAKGYPGKNQRTGTHRGTFSARKHAKDAHSYLSIKVNAPSNKKGNSFYYEFLFVYQVVGDRR